MMVRRSIYFILFLSNINVEWEEWEGNWWRFKQSQLPNQISTQTRKQGIGPSVYTIT